MVQTPPAISFLTQDEAIKPRVLGDNGLRLLYIGRFVRAKGVMDLLHAVRTFRKKSHQMVRLDLVGSKTFSDAGYVSALERYVTDFSLRGVCEFHFDAPTHELIQLLKGAHALVIPSYHEGFCVPVVESYACGCFVICSDAGALQETSGNIGRTYAMANADMLCARLEEFVAARRVGEFCTDGGVLSSEEWTARARAYASSLAPAHAEERFCQAVLAGIPRIESSVRETLSQRRRQLLKQIMREPICAVSCNSMEKIIGGMIANLDNRNDG
jgi:glycosyltransferase involved in cell wall biosynthesis